MYERERSWGALRNQEGKRGGGEKADSFTHRAAPLTKEISSHKLVVIN